jgi:hypothetical protein
VTRPPRHITVADLDELREEVAEIRSLLAEMVGAAPDPDDEAFVAVVAGCQPVRVAFTSRDVADSSRPDLHEARARYRLQTPAQIGQVLGRCGGLRVGDVRLVPGPRRSTGRCYSFEPVSE